jgi:homocysteine S-methyltransferase
VLDINAEWVKRIGGIRANASKCSHEELDNSEELDIGNPGELGDAYGRLTRSLPNIKVLGGCCGTDLRHIQAIAQNQFGNPGKTNRHVA